MRTGFKKYIRFFLFLFVLGLCLPAFGRFTAYAAAPEIRLNVKNISIVKDGCFTLKVYNTVKEHSVVFESENAEIASVSEEGVITGVANGSTVITVTVKENDNTIAALGCNVVIGPKAISIKLTKTELTMAVGRTKTLKTILTPMTTVEIAKFYSSDTAIATVSSSGRVRAKEVGQVQVFAFLENGKSAICNVNVLSEEDYKKFQDDRKAAGDLTDDEDETDPEAAVEPQVTDEPSPTASPSATQPPSSSQPPQANSNAVDVAGAAVVTNIP